MTLTSKISIVKGFCYGNSNRAFLPLLSRGSFVLQFMVKLSQGIDEKNSLPMSE